MKTRGVFLGKFNPFHKGHELAIRVAASVLDELHVVVSDRVGQKDLPLLRRSRAIAELGKDLEIPVTVRCRVDDSPPPKPHTIDQHGTVLDEDFQQYWVEVLEDSRPTHVVSSDMYGKVIAERMGIEWLPIDPDREMVQISGTKIRNNMDAYYHLISDYAKPSYRKTYAIVGAESTGKSTMVKEMSDLFQIPMVNEYGRTLSEAKSNNLTMEDFYNIDKTQRTLIDSMWKLYPNKRKMVVDTENITTYLFAGLYLGRNLSTILNTVNEIDHYIVLAPNVEWVDDGLRVVKKQEERERFHNILIDLLTDWGTPFTVVNHKSFVERSRAVARIINTT